MNLGSEYQIQFFGCDILYLKFTDLERHESFEVTREISG